MNKIPTEVLHKEIDLIQGCINRMAHNSFLIKGWAISIVAVVLALSKENIFSIQVILILMAIVFSFWYLDSYFLHTEKMYQALYKKTIEARLVNDSSELYSVDARPFKKAIGSFCSTIWSTTLRVFYGVPLGSMLIWLFLHYGGKIICGK